MTVYSTIAQSIDSHACCCVGPQNGDPVCPCQMRGVTVENGRYVKRQDLGPVSPTVNNRKFRESTAVDPELAKLLRDAVTS